MAVGVPVLLMGGLVLDTLSGLLRLLLKLLMAPLWFFDRWDKESLVLSIPTPVRRRLLKAMFGPTLAWTILLHRAMPDTRRWYDRVDERVILGALPLRSQLHALTSLERVTGVLNMCDEFAGNEEYERMGIRQLRLPTMDYCSPSAQQVCAEIVACGRDWSSWSAKPTVPRSWP
eukprot:scaffold312268_cov35-Tisochrysis_lutea.AAC.4